jgi:hypothetical protein
MGKGGFPALLPECKLFAALIAILLPIVVIINQSFAFDASLLAFCYS